jgi:hypothetical protein
MTNRSLFGLLAVMTVLLLGADDVLAVVGRPATPVSYAGVARRTSRRTARRTVARNEAVAATTVAALPAGCARVTGATGALYTCGGYYYRPTYDGPNVVYVVTNSP